jgi:hypothetical protein
MSGGIPEYRDGPVFTTMVPLAPKEVTKEVTVKVHIKVGGDFGVNCRVKFIENFRVKFRIKGNQLDRMTSMVIRLSSGRPLIVKGQKIRQQRATSNEIIYNYTCL